MSDALKKAGKDALGGGIPGAAAMAVQVSTLMWMRTLINYQYRYGTPLTLAFQTLYRDGGIRRFYRGYTAAMVQGPLSRFGDTAANSGVLSLLNEFPQTRSLPVAVQTAAASSVAAALRILWMPIDTIKTTLQVEGTGARALLREKIRLQGVRALFHGAMASSAATFVGHYPWFATYNYLQTRVPMPPASETKKRLFRNAWIGFIAAATSDICSNALRVIKTTRQTTAVGSGYTDVVRSIVEKDGVIGLFGRGLKTKLLTNGVQGMLFSVYWKMGQEYLEKTSKK